MRIETQVDLTGLARRVADMLDPLPDLDLEQDLLFLVDKMLLRTLEAEMKQWAATNPSSAEDMARGRELNTRLTELRLRIQRGAAAKPDLL